jgi:LysM repeat protein
MRVRAFLLAVLVLVLALCPAAASADVAHLVTPGETLTSVAAADDLSIEAIAEANHISPQAELIAGQILLIPPHTAQNAVVSTTDVGSTTATATVTATVTTTSTLSAHTHVIAPGETLTSVSAASGVSIAAIAAANHMSPRAELIAGRTLMIPTANTSVQLRTDPESAGTAARSQSSATASSATAATGAPQPTTERVSGGEIAGVADSGAVPAALAEAIAWQESGWNNDEVSSIGAVGVMQIVPTTWTWIDRYLTPGDPLGTASASENIRAGVLLLHQLLQVTGGNEALAVAGYYQGLASVRRYGMYPSTKQYVADVLALAQRF